MESGVIAEVHHNGHGRDALRASAARAVA